MSDSVRYAIEHGSPEWCEAVRHEITTAKLKGDADALPFAGEWDGIVWLIVRVEGGERDVKGFGFTEDEAGEFAADLAALERRRLARRGM